MSELQKQLDETVQAIKQNVPEDAFDTMAKETEQLKASGIEGRSVQNGESAPDFTLPNHIGKEMNLGNMLKDGPLVLSFYRGGW